MLGRDHRHRNVRRAEALAHPLARFTLGRCSTCHRYSRPRRLPVTLNGRRLAQRWCGPAMRCQGAPNGSMSSHNLRTPGPLTREARISTCGSFLDLFGIALGSSFRPCGGLQFLSFQPIPQVFALLHPVFLPQLVGPAPEWVFPVSPFGRHVSPIFRLRNENGVERCRLRPRPRRPSPLRRGNLSSGPRILHPAETLGPVRISRATTGHAQLAAPTSWGRFSV
jgi:hypothetical protein